MTQKKVHKEGQRSPKSLMREALIYAVCIAAAARLRLPLVTWGLEQRELATGIVDVFAPES